MNPPRAGALAAFISQGQRPTLEQVGRLLATDQIKKVVVLAGAGISTASGIPDFRSPETGLYANLAKYDLPYPEAIFEIGYFQSHPQPFFALAKELFPGNFVPTLTHFFLRLLDEKGKLLRCFTQNIDTLERLAGLDPERIVEAHGSFAASRCIRCKREVDEAWMKDKCMRGEVAYCPDEQCKKRTGNGRGGLVKPDIVFFGEGLPDRFFERLRDLKEADLLITMGTSLQVQPFASLIDHVSPSCPRLLINLERVGAIGVEEDLDDLISGLSLSSNDGSRMASRFRENGFDFDGLALGRGEEKKHLIRDVFYKGKTDDGVRELSRICGWEDELVGLWEEAKRQTAASDSAAADSPKAGAQTTREEVQEKADETAGAVAEAAAADKSASPSPSKRPATSAEGAKEDGAKNEKSSGSDAQEGSAKRDHKGRI